MVKCVSSLDLTFNQRPASQALTRWLEEELRRAILDGRLRPGTRLPATRDFARQYSLSRGTVVAAFEQLNAEGYLTCKVGAGTWVNARLSNQARGARKTPAAVRRLPPPMRGLTFRHPARPFRAHEPTIVEFPVDIWARVASRRLRRVSSSLLAGGDVRGYKPLREAIASYLGAFRGVNCSSDQIVVTSGVQQGLDLLARLIVKPGAPVWIEDPGYFGAATALQNAGAKIIPVPVDEHGLSVAKGRQLQPLARCVYLTPAHQFPLGSTMSLERRLAVLAWAREAGAFIIEDDYDSEYRFEGLPVPALQGLDKCGSVILVGSFNKLMFPSIRLGYIVAPLALVDPLLDLRFGTDQHASGPDQAILTDFILEGHFSRHLRRMRDLYGARLAALQDQSRRYLDGLLKISPVQAGLYTAGFLRNGITSREAEAAAAARKVETMGFDRFSLKRTDIQGLVLGFAAFDEKQISLAVAELARALEACDKKQSGLQPSNSGRIPTS
ncbi:MAG TPA: PLP-dependent aminotransferase family protein [Blastocatellia bacterium]|nr:PLP-dependent aminotransferase family protein [Blastocatellia bacterium]